MTTRHGPGPTGTSASVYTLVPRPRTPDEEDDQPPSTGQISVNPHARTGSALTKEKCFDEFWEVIARAHLEACRREAASALDRSAAA